MPGRLAYMLDSRMLRNNVLTDACPGQQIAPFGTEKASLAQKTGHEVSVELGGRYLITYLLPWQVGTLLHGADHLVYFTPTVLSRTEIGYLATPSTHIIRTHALLLDPNKLPSGYTVLGPRLIDMGGGIEYLLPNGFPREALVNIGAEPDTIWEVEID
jgi:hypothetical protein